MLIFSASLAFISACTQKHNNSEHYIRVGTIQGPETKLMEVAKQVAEQRFGLKIKIVPFKNYTAPNKALHDDKIDANAFQDYPFLLNAIKRHGYNFVAVGNTFLYPMGLYSKKIQILSALKAGSTVAIPHDPSNKGRALLLLQSAKLITLKSFSGGNLFNGVVALFNPTRKDIIKNPLHLKIITIHQHKTDEILNRVTLAAINTNYAKLYHLKASTEIFTEKSNSLYMNLIVVRTADRGLTRTRELVQAYQSKPVLAEARKLFGDKAIPGFSTN